MWNIRWQLREDQTIAFWLNDSGIHDNALRNEGRFSICCVFEQKATAYTTRKLNDFMQL